MPAIPEVEEVPLGVQVKTPPGAMLTGPERLKVVVVSEVTAVACMLPVPVRVPPTGPETVQVLLFTVKGPLPVTNTGLLEEAAVRLLKVAV